MQPIFQARIHWPLSGASAPSPLKNLISPNQFTLWQPHFDREFSSVYELLSIPLYGPSLSTSVNAFDANHFPTGTPAETAFSDLVTNRLPYCQGMSLSVKIPRFDPLLAITNSSGDPLSGDPGVVEKGVELTAAKKFLRPDFLDSIDSSIAFDNRWYRILDLFGSSDSDK